MVQLLMSAVGFLVVCSAFMSMNAGLSGVVAASRRLVFAHYVIWNPLFNETVEGFKQEILLAQTYGIDAFAINTQFWTGNNKRRPELLYQAAQELGTGFKLFFSADFGAGYASLTPDVLVTMITTFKNHPNQLYYNGKQVFTSWLGQEMNASMWRNQVLNPAGNNIFFIPFFPAGNNVDIINVNIMSKFSSVIDGVFAWDTSAWPYFDGDYNTVAGKRNDDAYLEATQKAGKIYMASVSPWYFNHEQTCAASQTSCPRNMVMGNYKGPNLWMTRWMQLINAPNIPMVEIVTWNDWQERHYTAAGPFQGEIANHTQFPHLPFLDLGSYYISWFKNGSPPPITKDSLYLFYYTHSKNAEAPNDPLGRVLRYNVLDDYVYVAVKLTAAATVKIISGTTSQNFNVDAGLQMVGMPFKEGTQTATLSRNGNTLLTVQGSLPINNNIQKYDFNVYSKFAST
eukprot:c15875_g1_i1 orf=111-1475(+)